MFSGNSGGKLGIWVAEAREFEERMYPLIAISVGYKRGSMIMVSHFRYFGKLPLLFMTINYSGCVIQ